MSKKDSSFFEEHIEKIVLAVVGLVCLWLFFTRVVFSPNVVSYDNRKFSPGAIDNYINEQAERLRQNLDEPAGQLEAYIPRFTGPISPDDPVRADIRGNLRDGFDGLFSSAIRDIDVSIVAPLPPYIWKDIRDNREYALPVIGKVNEVAVGHIRAAAYVPAVEIDEENIYSQQTSEVNDLDLVTVEAKLDVKGLYEQFYERFASPDINEQWRDPCLAKPVFAAVQLQRQDLQPDGSWSDWQIVPRSKIEARRRMLEVIEDVEKLPPGGIKVRLLQFEQEQVRKDILQPAAYQIASAKEDWLPPLLHKTFVQLRRDIEAQERRKVKEAERGERERVIEQALAERRSRMAMGSLGGEEYEGYDESASGEFYGRRPSERGRRSRSPRGRAARGRRGRYGEHENYEEYSEYERGRRRTASREDSRPRSIGDVYSKFNELLITQETDFAKMREPLLCWAYDDTCQPEKSYRYKMRIGVFNPIAGTEQVSEQYKSQKNKVILWSDFSDVTETVEIPGRFYFFPVDIREAANMVKVQVCKYVLGYWYSNEFTVKPGEAIGDIVETEILAEQSEDLTVPEMIDYSTGAVLVDTMPVSDWSGVKYLRPRHYFNMLVSCDGTNIEHTPIRSTYWAKELLVKFAEINRAVKELKEPLRAWGSGVTVAIELATELEEWEEGYEDEDDYEDYDDY